MQEISSGSTIFAGQSMFISAIAVCFSIGAFLLLLLVSPKYDFENDMRSVSEVSVMDSEILYSPTPEARDSSILSWCITETDHDIYKI